MIYSRQLFQVFFSGMLTGLRGITPVIPMIAIPIIHFQEQLHVHQSRLFRSEVAGPCGELGNKKLLHVTRRPDV